MAKFLTTSGISFNIENVIKNANEKLVLISPYIKLSKNFFQRLIESDAKGLKIVIIYGKSDLNEHAKNDLTKLKNIQVYFAKDLHAKCYFNEKEMVLASMNMYDFSENNNREMGVYFSKIVDKEIYEDAVIEAQSIVRAAKKIDVNDILINKDETSYKSYYYDDEDDDEEGFCIRCGEEIEFDEDKPYCYKCYKIWSKYEDDDYEEKYCHSCGKKFKSSMCDPICSKCD